MTEESLLLAEGRRLGFATFADPDGRAVIYAHGFPACRLEAELFDGAAREVGAWLIAPDRPGFGRSDFQPARAVLDWPSDVAQLADALGLARFSLLGGSAGCPYALATACRLPERTRRVALIAGLAPATRQRYGAGWDAWRG